MNIPKLMSGFLLCTLILVLNSFGNFARQADSLKADTTKSKVAIDYVTRMQSFASKSAKESAAEFEADKAAMAQARILEELKKVMQKAKS